MRKSFILILVLLSVVCFVFTAQADDPTAVRRVYTVTAPYLTTADEISFGELSAIWTDDIADETDGINNILVSEDELPALISIFGKEPGKRITVLSKNELYADPNLASAWMIVPFEDIEPGDDFDLSELVGYTYVSADEKISFTFLENSAVYTSYGTMQELTLKKVEGAKLTYEKDGIEYNFFMGYHPFLLCDFTERKFLQVQPEEQDG